ncbi:Hypothetical protein NTJ_05521 [Nesidiocoris tenuis]|uniref:Uncharacterized protein n=1 Tax=Nesidiocoris tenuis TaxID=355587 RepID=A0ABN7AKC8_9HEMI|nr:Hypothetical protein NTJ_05521 [Nesidiocoris tenuis]
MKRQELSSHVARRLRSEASSPGPEPGRPYSLHAISKATPKGFSYDPSAATMTSSLLKLIVALLAIVSFIKRGDGQEFRVGRNEIVSETACNFWIGVRPHLTCVCVNRPVTEYPRPESDYADEYLKKGHPDRFFWSCFSLDDFKDYVVPTEGP